MRQCWCWLCEPTSVLFWPIILLSLMLSGVTISGLGMVAQVNTPVRLGIAGQPWLVLGYCLQACIGWV